MITKDALTQANLLPVSLSLKRGLLRLRRLTAPSALPVIILRLISAGAGELMMMSFEFCLQR